MFLFPDFIHKWFVYFHKLATWSYFYLLQKESEFIHYMGMKKFNRIIIWHSIHQISEMTPIIKVSGTSDSSSVSTEVSWISDLPMLIFITSSHTYTLFIQRSSIKSWLSVMASFKVAQISANPPIQMQFFITSFNCYNLIGQVPLWTF